MKIFRNLKLQYKMLILAIIPVLVMGIVAILISNTVVKNKLLDDAKQKLKATSNAVLAAYDQNAGDYFVNATGDVWKGAYNVSLSTPFIDDIAAKTGIEVTFFYNDTRLVTSLKDADGKRILGSKAGDFLVENVLQDGNEVFTNRVLVDGTFYFGYYVPVYQNNSDEIIGNGLRRNAGQGDICEPESDYHDFYSSNPCYTRNRGHRMSACFQRNRKEYPEQYGCGKTDFGRQSQC